MLRYTVDRIEGNYAVCLDEKGFTINVLLSQIEFQVTEGMFLLYDSDKVCFYYDREETEKHLENKTDRLTNLFNRGKK